jgi:hypothetical protein
VGWRLRALKQDRTVRLGSLKPQETAGRRLLATSAAGLRTVLKKSSNAKIRNLTGSLTRIIYLELAGYSSHELVEELINRLEETRSTAEILRLCSAINQSAKGDFPKINK